MNHGFMPDHVFNVGAVVIAKIFVETGQPIRESACNLAEKYRRGYEDDDFEKLWVIVARSLIDSGGDKQRLWAKLHLLLFFVSEYDADGVRRKRKLLNGAVFNKQREPVPDRIEKFGFAYAKFLTLLATEKLPLPPKG